MKAIFKQIVFSKEGKNAKGKFFKFDVKYDVEGKERIASFFVGEKEFNHDTEEQTVFKEGEENEFNEVPRQFSGKTYYTVYPPKKSGGKSAFNKNLQREQARYSGFAMAYAKDLVVAGKIPKEDMYDEADEMFSWMVTKDKELKDGK